MQGLRTDLGEIQQQADVLVGLVKGEAVFLVQAVEPLHEREDFLGRDEYRLGLVLLVVGAILDGQRFRVVEESRGNLLPTCESG